MAASRDDGFIASLVGLAALRCLGNSNSVGVNLASIGAPPSFLRPAAHCPSSRPNSASRASNVGRSEGDSSFYLHCCDSLLNPQLLAIVEGWIDGIAAALKENDQYVEFGHDRDN
jgi:hypothetical protein